MPAQPEQFADALRVHAPAFGLSLQPDEIRKLTGYYELITKWNQRLHLVAPCSPEEFATRHVLESLMLLKHLPANANVVDIGSGGGLPMIPCLLVRSDLHATLIESSTRKAVFLREALRAAQPPGRGEVIAARFEDIEAPDADFVTCRALEKFNDIFPKIVRWKPTTATFLLFVGETLRKLVESSLKSVTIERMPESEARYLLIGRTT
jgi:16S rRNA (guanine(527)-N(7))-methyltransferase RsmG